MTVKGPNNPTVIPQGSVAVRLTAWHVAGKGYVAQCQLCGYETDPCSAMGLAQGELAAHLVMGCNNENAARIEADIMANIGAALDPATCPTCIGKGIDPAWNSKGRACPACGGSGDADQHR